MAIIALAALELARLTDRRDRRLWGISIVVGLVTAVTGTQVALRTGDPEREGQRTEAGVTTCCGAGASPSTSAPAPVWTTAQRCAISLRDHDRCRFVACERRTCDVHHLRHFADGGFPIAGEPNGTLTFHRPDGASWARQRRAAPPERESSHGAADGPAAERPGVA